MLIDEVTINLSAGRGGNGVVRWRHEKGKEYAGAGGGNGGKGGDVYAKAIRDIGVLARFRQIKALAAGNGGNGENWGRHGKTGGDLVIEVPIGAVLTNLETKERFELLEEGEQKQVLKGGRGGLGNEHFKASTNVTPRQSTPGTEGESADFLIELQLIADIGLIGFPNAGKTSLLNTLTRAAAKVGDYPFTTLEPNLGAMYGFILADIPGLIEGASEGKGLGDKFLRHIRRTKLLVHCISLENDDFLTAYRTIQNELKAYDPMLSKKDEVVILTKTDLVDKKKITAAKKVLKKLNSKIYEVSVYDDVSIKKVTDTLVKLLRKK